MKGEIDMNENDFKPNSHKYKADVYNVPEGYGSAEEKKVEKVINGTAKIKKKTEARKFADAFISEDAHHVKEYIFMDVLVPGIKKAVYDIVINGLDMILYGETGRSDRRKSPSEKVSYRNYYDDRRDRDRHRDDYRGRTRYSYDDISVPTRGEAERVLTCMEELIEEYGHVTVADLYDLVGVSGEFTDNNYGWINLRNASVVRCSDGYRLKLPKALPIRK